MKEDPVYAPTPDSFDCPLIVIAGNPRERGRQYGEQAATRVRRGIDHYAGHLEANRLGWPDIREIAASFEPTIAAFDPALLDVLAVVSQRTNLAARPRFDGWAR